MKPLKYNSEFGIRNGEALNEVNSEYVIGSGLFRLVARL